MSVPANRKYSATHEWYQVEGQTVTMGITQYAADELTDITYVDLPEVGKTLQAGGVAGEIESVKATSELICAVGGKVAAINEALIDRPELLNEDAFDAGWIVRIDATDVTALATLMDAAAYEKHLEG